MDPGTFRRELSLRAVHFEQNAFNHPLVRDLVRKGLLRGPLLERLSATDEPAALNYLFREISLDGLNLCLGKIRDQAMAGYLLDGVLMIAALLSSEAFSGFERAKRALRALQPRLRKDPVEARRLYDREVEALGQHVFAIGRRLNQIEAFFASCPFSGSAEFSRGLYGQRVRDLAGSVRLLSQDLDRWVRRYVPIGKNIPSDEESLVFLEARIHSVVDDLGLRVKEIHENLTSAIFDQLSIFDETLTPREIFKRDLENLLDLDHLLGWLGELVILVRRYDELRERALLEEVKSLLRAFRPEQFPAFSGIRESDHALFTSFAQRIHEYQPESAPQEEDPVQVFLLLLGDLFSSLKQRRAEPASFEL